MKRMLELRAGLLLGLISILAGTGAQSAFADDNAAGSRPIVLKAAHLFDAVSGALVEHGIVVVSGGKIQSVGATIPSTFWNAVGLRYWTALKLCVPGTFCW